MSNAFDEAWLIEHRARMARIKSVVDSIVPTYEIRFTLARPYPLLNRLLTMHPYQRRRYMKDISREIAAQTPQCRGMTPWPKAELTVTRYSVGEPDEDGLTPKALIDCLIPSRAVLMKNGKFKVMHRYGLGFVVDDSPAHLTVNKSAVRVAKRSEQRTECVLTQR